MTRNLRGSSSQSVAGVGTSFSYNPSGQATQVTREGRSTAYAYDGLGRQASSTDQTKYGTETTAKVFAGTSLVQSTSSTQGTTTVVRDAAGALAEHVTASGEATWDLLDGLGSTIAGVTGGSVTQLASYDDWGGQSFETDGWDAPEGYTGHVQDATQGLMHTFARSYDVGTGTWTSPDTWRGLLTQPKSLARYQYAWSNPTTFWDPDGHRCASKPAGNDGLLQGCGAPPVQATQAVKDPPTANDRGGRDALPSGNGTSYNPKNLINGPATQNRLSALHRDDVNFKVPSVNLPTGAGNSHGCPAGTEWYENSYTNGQCANSQYLKEQNQFWENIANYVAEHGSLGGQFCGLVICVQLGNGGGGIGPAVGAGGSVAAGLSNGDVNGLGFQFTCWAADGGGVYASYSRDWLGRDSADSGITAGGGAGCSGYIMWYF
ncbi:hypothetical protein LLS1_03560 [Leifsonia sp. LS1]|uniref:RHS repeat-associated core domain-containing protein n=1 Tax=Leifsonia sp. LS1 TaxID=2828483 RepID=UPI001CFE75E8|nr:RHS repeat-associated core domain-containing protein [Leifsonia sp. LS1]GIT78687.1 hypothetical protein LLS1_03560 [Leifsonia sp. LS1]